MSGPVLRPLPWWRRFLLWWWPGVIRWVLGLTALLVVAWVLLKFHDADLIIAEHKKAQDKALADSIRIASRHVAATDTLTRVDSSALLAARAQAKKDSWATWERESEMRRQLRVYLASQGVRMDSITSRIIDSLTLARAAPVAACQALDSVATQAIRHCAERVAARDTVIALQSRRIALLSHPTPDPRLLPWAEAIYETGGSVVPRVGVSVRVSERWSLVAVADYDDERTHAARVGAGVRLTFR